MNIGHMAVWSRDIDRLRTFYITYFDARSNDRYINAQKGFSSFFLSFESGARLEIMQNDSIPDTANDPFAQAQGLTHLAFETESEKHVDALTDRLRQDGYTVVDGPRRTGDGCYESLILDPDNNRIEITA
ncbi:VOC family protein [Pontiella sulfatireligans]|uniref:VOC domain-containing protein n=1 Tax=Pontiella sulfatireligans TaxID=2750658 RepID=A0A6C2USS7_9BACT|nr:VOC family protein [Pontiella sulfatireligans]VGO23390.1 hypothetical protein SCARR_05497 [Pontiella sulfatireligans]